MDSAQLLDTIIMSLVKETGSDIHLVSGVYPAIRVHSEILPLTKLKILDPTDTLGCLREMINDTQYEMLIHNQQLDFAYTHRGEYRLRGNAFFQKGSIAVVMRLITKIKSLGDLNLPEVLLDFAHRKQGFFLVVGPVGQGKTSTLAAMIDDINQKDRKMIVTIEDPIEYIYEPKNSYIMQREVGFDTLDFESGLHASFRQDIDVLLIGEMRNTETMRAAVTAAETGHLVFSTLHTNSASQTIDRIIDSFPAEQQGQIRSQLAASLIGIFSQRLIPKIGGGLVPAYELLVATPAVQNLIREKRTFEIDTVIETGREYGMINFDSCLSDLVRRGDITLESAMRIAKNPKVFGEML